jgi:DNA invertase Pin-like site-specific DNA recombinase
MSSKRVPHIPLDKREPATVRAVILARVSDPGEKDVTVEQQDDVGKPFIARMGWRYCGTYSDKRSGFLNVRRQGLDEVERLIQRRDVDVVVVMNWERLARKVERRYAALWLARKYGCEYRFVELLPDGKLPDTTEAKIQAAVMEVFGEIEREKIIERTKRGRLKRATLGLPSGGRGGATYGFQVAREGEPYSVWMEDETEGPILREMFERVDTDETVSGNSLAADFLERGIFTREGNTWTSTTVLEKLSNPLYCGRARLNRWIVEWLPKTDEDTGETYHVRTVRERTPDDEGEDYPIAPGTMPVLVEPDLFDRVQRMLAVRSKQSGKVGRANSPHLANATLLNGEFVICAHCHHLMVRFWRHDTRGAKDNPIPYYRCGLKGRDPAATCKVHMTPAPAVDALVMKLLAFALTDPEQLIALADANTQRHADAVTASEIAGAKLDGYAERLKEIATEKQRLLRKLNLSDPANEDDAEDIVRYRERIARIEIEHSNIETEMARLTPERERALDRQTFLRTLFTVRDSWINFATDETGETGQSHIEIHKWLDLSKGAALLGVPESQIDLPIRRTYGSMQEFRDGPTVLVEEEHVATVNVVLKLLRRSPRDKIRRVLRDLGAVVEISRPRPPAERATHGSTPVEERVTLVIGALRLRWPQVIAEHENPLSLRSPGDANGTQLAMPTMSTPAAQISGYVVTAASTMNPP